MFLCRPTKIGWRPRPSAATPEIAQATQGIQKRARTETCLGLAKLRELHEIRIKSGSIGKKKTIFVGKETHVQQHALRKFFPFAERKRI